MNWDKKLTALERILAAPCTPLSSEAVLPLIDFTRLDALATRDDIAQCAAQALQHQVSALCILPQHLQWVPQSMAIPCATVINFPTGNDLHRDNLLAIEQAAIHPKLCEIDYVFPYSAYLSGQRAHALSCCQEAYQTSKQHGLLFKVILETGALPSLDVIYKLSLDVIHHGCDFLKTSTGKIATGATIPAAIAMLSAIVDSNAPCGIKLSGGIKTTEQASLYLRLAEHMRAVTANKHWFRFGMSHLLPHK